MIAKLEFDLDDPVQAGQYNDCMDAWAWKEIVVNTVVHMKDMIKHNVGNRTQGELDVIRESLELIEARLRHNHLEL